MTLDLNKFVIYADPYTTNRNYLRNMTKLQVKALEEMKLKRRYRYKYINTGLWHVPWAWIEEKSIKYSVKDFIDSLNESIMGL